MPNYNEMSPEDMQRIYTYNNLRRARLLNRANKLSTDKEKAQFIVDYFTNNLPKNIIAEIDDVEEKDVVNFTYDYSYVKGGETPFARKQQRIKYPLGHGMTLSCVDRDFDVDGRPKIYPTIFSLKSGTCVMFAHEIKRLLSSLNINCQIIETEHGVDCYDHFDGMDTQGNKINVNTIKKIKHAYNIIELDGKQIKIDIAGYLTANDYNNNHPLGKSHPIDPTKFCMTEDISHNQFEEVSSNSIID
ncbi:MAG: hypothetical protein E7345_04315 [Clostridiales bacterium]|nr:hypothetical protein [Clostridiales bacterium]